MSAGETTKQDVWDSWVAEYVAPDQHIPLFETDSDGVVRTKTHGRDNRPILKRHTEMEDRLRAEGWKVVDDWKGSDDTYEGIIYMMYTLDGEEIVPRYIGKAGKYGRDGKGLSANLKSIRTNNSKLARWGDGYAYHFGELSRALLNLHERDDVDSDDPPSGKYQQWADTLFIDGTRKLVEPVHFWVKAWRTDDTGPFYDFETTLEALEYNLINLASDLYGESVFNSEGA